MFIVRAIKQLYYRLVCVINYPTSRERMWNMFTLGKIEGRKEALKELPIVQVQPRQTPKVPEVHLPPGEWSRLYREAHGLHKIALEPPQDDSWLNSKPVIRSAHKDDTEGEPTEHMTAIKKLRYITRQLDERHAG